MPTINTADGKELKYVFIEAIHSQNNKHDVVAGLFKGLQKVNDDTFLLLRGLGEHEVHCLSLRFYGIMMIETLENTSKVMVYLTSEKADQETGMEIVRSLYKELVDAGRVVKNDKGLIDTSTYTDVPSEYYKEEAVDRKNSTVNTGIGSFASGAATKYNGTGNNIGYNNNNYNYKKTPEPFLFERTNKKPTADALTILSAKMDQIKAGTYEAIIPEVNNDNDDDDDGDDEDGVHYGYY